MFDLFKKKKSSLLPEAYSNLIDDNGYKIFLEKCLSALSSLNYKVISSEKGDIVYMNENNQEAHFFLDNLLRIYLQTSEEEKNNEILSHFVKLKDQNKAYNYLYKDFDYAKQFLKILIKADDIIPNIENFVFQRDLKNLLTFLVFDFENQFHYIHRNEAQQWSINDSELFEIALENISIEEIDIKQYKFKDQYEVFAIFNDDFAAAFTLLIADQLDFSIGRFGTLVAIPTRGTIFLHPIEVDNVLDVIVSIYPTVEQFFDEDPGNITLDFYWHYNGRFEIFSKIVEEDGSVLINMPEELSNLYNNC